MMARSRSFEQGEPRSSQRRQEPLHADRRRARQYRIDLKFDAGDTPLESARVAGDCRTAQHRQTGRRQVASATCRLCAQKKVRCELGSRISALNQGLVRGHYWCDTEAALLLLRRPDQRHHQGVSRV